MDAATATPFNMVVSLDELNEDTCLARGPKELVSKTTRRIDAMDSPNTGKCRDRLVAPAVASEGAPLLGVALHQMDLLIRFRPRIIRGKQPRESFWSGHTLPATLRDTWKFYERDFLGRIAPGDVTDTRCAMVPCVRSPWLRSGTQPS